MMYTDITFPGLGGLQIDPPDSFSIGSFKIYFYGVIIALGLMLAVAYGLKRSKQFGIKKDDILDGVLWIVPFAVICARAYYVLAELDQFPTFLDMINIRRGGLAIYGGVIGAAIGVTVFTRIKKINLPALLDLVALGFLIGQAIGRWGNFMNREAFGCYTDSIFAMRIPASELPNGTGEMFMAQVQTMKDMAVAGGYEGYIQVHPTFLYESVWNAVGFVALHFLSKKRQYDGQIALGYVAWYGLGRALIEGLRMDSLYWGPFRVSQLLAAVTCLIAVVILLAMNLRKHDRNRLYVNYVNKMDAAADAAKALWIPASDETANEEADEGTDKEAVEKADENQDTE